MCDNRWVSECNVVPASNFFRRGILHPPLVEPALSKVHDRPNSKFGPTCVETIEVWMISSCRTPDNCRRRPPEPATVVNVQQRGWRRRISQFRRCPGGAGRRVCARALPGIRQTLLIAHSRCQNRPVIARSSIESSYQRITLSFVLHLSRGPIKTTQSLGFDGHDWQLR